LSSPLCILKNPKLYARTGDQPSFSGQIYTDKTFLAGCLENENVEGDIEADVTKIDAKDENHVFRAQTFTNGELRY
jgi:hypothetical protein